MKNFALAFIAIFVAAAFVIFAQQGHGDSTPNTFLFIHKTILGITSLVIAGIITAIYIKIPKSK